MNRQQLRAALHKIHGTPASVETIMYLVDQYVATITDVKSAPETWTAEKVATYLNLANPDAARSIMSRAGIRALAVEQIPGQRAYARYPADQVRALRKERNKR